MNITNLTLLLNNYPVFKAKRALANISAIPEDKYQEYIETKKNKIVNFHLSNNPFYKSKVVSKVWTWNELPVLTKSDIQTNFNDRLSIGVDKFYTGKTSGSTGNPFYFAKDKFTHALTWANIENKFSNHGLYDKKQARFYGIPKNTKDYYLSRIKDVLMNRYRFDVFDLSDEAFAKWVINFKKNKYVFLNGYTTVLVAFAKYLLRQQLVLKDICPTVKNCVVTSEMCFEEDRILMEKAFGVKVINEYGASELDLIAFENTRGEWVLNTETLFVEVLDEDNKPVIDGEMGRIVITSLYNKANSFIRYDIGDSGTIERINSKKVILKKLIGRNEDYVKLPSGKIAPGLSLYYVTKSIMEKNSVIKEIKVTQKTLVSFLIEYASEAHLDNDQKQEIKDALYEYLEPGLDISFQRLDMLKRSKSGKLKQFTSLIN